MFPASSLGLISLTLGHLLIDLCMNWIPPLLPFIAARMDLSIGLAGTAVALTATLSSFLQPVLGWFGDRIGRGGLLAVCVLWTPLFMILVSFAGGFPMLLALAILAGIGSACYHPLGSVRIVSLYPAHKAKVMSIYSAGGSLGYALAPVVAVPAVMAWGMEGSLVLVLPALLIAAMVALSGRRRLQERLLEPRLGLRAGQSRYGVLIKLQLVMALRSWVIAALATFLLWHLVAEGIAPALAAVILTAFLVAGTAGGLAGGVLADRWGHYALILWSGIVSIPLLLFALAGSGWPAMLALLLGGAAMYSAFPGSVVLAQELVPAHAGMAAGLMMGFTFGLGGLGVAVTGFMADAWGLGQALQLTVLALVAATVATPWLRYGARRQQVSA